MTAAKVLVMGIPETPANKVTSESTGPMGSTPAR